MRLIRRLVGLVPVIAITAGCANNAPPAETKTAAAPAAAPAQSPVERGKYLTLVGGCNDCHTPKKPGPNGPEADMDRQLSGNPADDKLAPIPNPKGLFAKYGTLASGNLTAWAGPWGVSFAMNLTPDK